jgi:uncharacterized HAD superfamily protein
MVYVDLDDVLSATTSTYVDIAAQEFGKKIDYEELRSFDLKASFHLTEREYVDFFDRIHQTEILMGFLPVKGAVDTVTKWNEEGWHIAVVTGRPASTYDVSLEWLNQNAIPYHSFTIVDKYGRENKETSDAVTLEEFSKNGSFSFAVEDSWNMAVFLAETMDIPCRFIQPPLESEKS